MTPKAEWIVGLWRKERIRYPLRVTKNSDVFHVLDVCRDPTRYIPPKVHVMKRTNIPELPKPDEILDLPDIVSHENKVNEIREALNELKADAKHTRELLKTKRA